MFAVRLIVVGVFAARLAAGQGEAVDQQSIPVYLPIASFWRHALSVAQPLSGNAELDEAYRKYRAGDFLTARSHLYRARQSVGGPAGRTLRLRALSLTCLLNMGLIPNTHL